MRGCDDCNLIETCVVKLAAEWEEKRGNDDEFRSFVGREKKPLEDALVQTLILASESPDTISAFSLIFSAALKLGYICGRTHVDIPEVFLQE